ncbi:MAG: 16S rRNA (cytosine(1402)-N(4))-methyltransferase RsmH [Thermotogaceae bacterium]|nr:16S rRNA (cytosine(1402)-N(4))-methyltransferase RsmH [Thermotogaceae bacterium]
MAEHIPVLSDEILYYLGPKGNRVYVDCTLGAGGHTLAILGKCESCFVLAFEVDPIALSVAERKIFWMGYERRVRIFNESYVNLLEKIEEAGFERVDGIIADLGLSSLQLVDVNRGFSYLHDSPLDMRMDPSGNVTAWDVVNRYPEFKLYEIIKKYGEEPFAKKIARNIVLNRPINTTFELVEVIRKSIPPKALRTRKRHFATRTFQAIRIEVNQELANIQKLMEASEKALKPGGRIGVISFHSLEDRIVKNFFRSSKCLKPLTKKPVTPTYEEIRRNPRSRSAKLRVAERSEVIE